jgi:hypothetical protein
MTEEKAKCNQCGFGGHPDLFDASMTYHHDLRCPNEKCGSTDIDTSDLNLAWAERGEKYGFGNHNSMTV